VKGRDKVENLREDNPWTVGGRRREINYYLKINKSVMVLITESAYIAYVQH